MSTRDSVYAVCPFWQSIKDDLITCDGAFTRSIRMTFGNYVEARDHFENCCESWAYQSKCPVARMLTEESAKDDPLKRWDIIRKKFIGGEKHEQTTAKSAEA